MILVVTGKPVTTTHDPCSDVMFLNCLRTRMSFCTIFVHTNLCNLILMVEVDVVCFCHQIVLKLQKEIAQLREENQMLRAKLGEQNIEVELPTNSVLPSPPPSSRTKRGRVARNPPASSSDKWPSELKGIEKYFSKDFSCKDFAKEPPAATTTATPGLSVFATFQVQE